MSHVLARRQDQEVRHHAGVLVRKYVAVEDGLAHVLLITLSDDDGLSRADPQRVLNGARRKGFSVDGDDFEAVDVDVERVSLIAAGVSGADLDPPLLDVVEVRDDGYLFLVVDGVVDEKSPPVTRLIIPGVEVMNSIIRTFLTSSGLISG